MLNALATRKPATVSRKRAAVSDNAVTVAGCHGLSARVRNSTASQDWQEVRSDGRLFRREINLLPVLDWVAHDSALSGKNKPTSSATERQIWMHADEATFHIAGPIVRRQSLACLATETIYRYLYHQEWSLFREGDRKSAGTNIYMSISVRSTTANSARHAKNKVTAWSASVRSSFQKANLSVSSDHDMFLFGLMHEDPKTVHEESSESRYWKRTFTRAKNEVSACGSVTFFKSRTVPVHELDGNRETQRPRAQPEVCHLAYVYRFWRKF